MLRELINATLGFEQLSKQTDLPSKSLHRMLSPKGNPSMDNLAAIFGAAGAAGRRSCTPSDVWSRPVAARGHRPLSSNSGRGLIRWRIRVLASSNHLCEEYILLPVEFLAERNVPFYRLFASLVQFRDEL
jgi:hypothetical protein